MENNLAGLNGRNIEFREKGKQIQAYIIKYTPDGKYYALSKTDGTLYEFTQTENYDSEGTPLHSCVITAVDYEQIHPYGYDLTKDNWQSFIDFQSKNYRKGLGDTLTRLQILLFIFSGVYLLGGAILFALLGLFGLVFSFAIVGLPAAFIFVLALFIGGSDHSVEDNAIRSLLSDFGPKDPIDYAYYQSQRKNIRKQMKR